jgi:hypothetical protein
VDGFLALVDSNRDETVSLEQALVHIPSVNTGFMPTGDETAVCEYIRRQLSKDGIQAKDLDAIPGRGMVRQARHEWLNVASFAERRRWSAGVLFRTRASAATDYAQSSMTEVRPWPGAAQPVASSRKTWRRRRQS